MAEEPVTVTPATLMRGDKYECVPEGFGGAPTRYQLGDSQSAVTMKFPSVALYRKLRDLDEKIDQISKRSRDAGVDLTSADVDEMDGIRYEQAKLAANGEIPDLDKCFMPVVARMTQDFLNVLMRSYGRDSQSSAE